MNKNHEKISMIGILSLCLAFCLLFVACQTVPEPMETTEPIETETAVSTDPTSSDSTEEIPVEKTPVEVLPFADIPRVSQEGVTQWSPFLDTLEEHSLLDLLADEAHWMAPVPLLSPEQLAVLRNGVYARNGYVFRNPKWQEIFDGVDWYQPNPAFTESDLDEWEHEQIRYIQRYEQMNHHVCIGGSAVAWDLDGDGAEELIQISFQEQDRYTLHINHAQLEALGDNPSGYFSVTDFDREDDSCEIMVTHLGPSSDDSFHLYTWKKGEIVKQGEVDGWLEQASGAGHVLVSTRASLLQTWFILVPWQLDEYGRFVRMKKDVPPYFPVDARWEEKSGDWVLVEMPPEFRDPHQGEWPVPTALMDVPLVVSPTEPNIAGVLQAGEQVAFTATDNSSWVRVMGRSGTEGWFKLQDYNHILMEEGAVETDKVFSGLNYSD